MSDSQVAFSPVQQDAPTLRALRRRALILAAITLPAILLTVYLVLSKSRAVRVADLAERAIPALFTTPTATWTSSAMKFSELEMQVLETRDYVYRTYTDGKGTPIDLCVVFSEDNRKGTHPPDVCLEASGCRIVRRFDRELMIDNTPLTVRELITTNAGGQYIYFAYFYKCGSTLTPSFYRQQMQIVWNGLRQQDASGALIRFSTQMYNASDLERARGRVEELLRLSFPSIRDRLTAQS